MNFEIEFYKSPVVVQGTFASHEVDWRVASHSLAVQAYGSLYSNLIGLKYMFGIQFGSDHATAITVEVELTDSNVKKIKLLSLQTTTVVLSAYAYIAFDLNVWKYGDGLNRVCKRHFIDSFLYSTFHGLQSAMVVGWLPILQRPSESGLQQEFQDGKVTLLWGNHGICNDHDMTIQCINQSADVFVTPNQPLYSQLTEVVLQRFTFPALHKHNVHMLPNHRVHDALFDRGADPYLCERLERKTFVVQRAMQAGNKLGVLWSDHLDRVQADLSQIARVTPKLAFRHNRMRELFINPMVLQVCVLTQVYVTMQEPLHARRSPTPPQFTGAGPVDYLLHNNTILLTVPAAEDFEDFCDWENELQEWNEEREGPLSDQQYAQYKIPMVRAEQAYHALGAGHDLLSSRSNPSSVVVVSTSLSYRAYHLTAPTEPGGKVAVCYGGELHLLVQKAPGVDREQVLRVMCLLVLSISNAYRPVPITAEEEEEFGSAADWANELSRRNKGSV